jgi:hypothetical protein
MAFREKAQKVMRNAQDKVGDLQSRGGTGGKAIKATVAGGKKANEVAGKASAAVVKRTTKFIGLERYRKELEAALDEATRVIAAQEARIALLEADRNLERD